MNKRKDIIEPDAEANKKFLSSLIKNYWDRMSEVYDTASYIIYLENLLKLNEIEFDHREFKVVEDIREWIACRKENGNDEKRNI